MRNPSLFPLLALLFALLVCSGGTAYDVGIGIADTTGPAAEIPMMGYGSAAQNHGIHTRLFARAFIFADGDSRVVFVSVDAAMIGHLVKNNVIRQLSTKFGHELYRHENVLLSATHTHSGPAGYVQYLFFQMASLGFIRDSLEAMVGGIVRSVERAHLNMKPSKVFVAKGVPNSVASMNRSPTSYLENPEEERHLYSGNTDGEMIQLNIFSADNAGLPRGVVNWFPVHATSMNKTNKHISGDNKGAASLFLEKRMNGKETLPGKGEFVAAFASSNSGDVSPNMKGPRCIDTGLPCDSEQSTCDGRTQNCVAFGPGEDMFESTRLIGQRLSETSHYLLTSKNQTEVEGPIRFIHQWVNMSDVDVVLSDNVTVKTCSPALGYSFGAGTTDGPGGFDFTQGTNKGNPFWDTVSRLVKAPTEEQIRCHAPKPILLNTGKMIFPYEWHPTVIDTQLLQLGQLLMVALPGEFTTMAGRRLRKAVATAAAGGSDQLTGDREVVLAGLSNVYSHYIVTYEEYQKQRYEAGSTIFGPHSLEAYLQQFSKLARALVKNEEANSTVWPPDLSDLQLSYMPSVIFDNPKLGYSFGDCLLEPDEEVFPGDVVTVRFVAGHLRNNLMTDSSFLYVERQREADGTWKRIASDADWETRLKWIRTNVLIGCSEAEVRWEVPADVEPGTYRITHEGYHKSLISKQRYQGSTRTFSIDPAVAPEAGVLLSGALQQRRRCGLGCAFVVQLFSFLPPILAMNI